VEVHLLDFHGDLYDTSLRVHLIERLRGEQRFDGLDALKAQISRDVIETRRVLERVVADPGAGGAWF
jgi:riboflavin kinase/FMN adenylyltransferase